MHPNPQNAPRLDEETFRRLLVEGQELRRLFEIRTAPMRILTADDHNRRSR